MKSKKTILLMVVLAVSLVFMGCNAISSAFDSVFLTTPEVKTADLADYSTAAGEASTEADVERGFALALEAAGGQAPAMKVLGSDYDSVMNVLKMSSPEFSAVLGGSVADSRKLTAGANASISDEEVIESGVTFTINDISVSGDIEIDSLKTTTEQKVKFDAKAEIEISEFTDPSVYYNLNYYSVTVKDLIFNFNGNGNATQTYSTAGVFEQIDYYLGFDMSLGFSLESSGCSGKYIVNLKYVNSAVVTANDTDYTGGEVLEVVVTAYNNSGTELAKKTYTSSAFLGAVSNAVPSTPM